jgi:hypothetical protein
MGLTLSQIGLFLATSILLIAVFVTINSSDWQKTAELQSLASSFSALLEDMDSSFIEHTTLFLFPENGYSYTVKLSTEYIVISKKESQGTTPSVLERFLTRPWIRLPEQNWTTGADIHAYLNITYGHQGTSHDPLFAENFTDFMQEHNTLALFFAIHPLEIIIREPVVIEKVTIFYNDTKRLDLLLVYQT